MAESPAFKDRGGYSDTEQEILFCVVTRLELTKLEAIVKAKDKGALIVVSSIHETSEDVVKKRPFY